MQLPKVLAETLQGGDTRELCERLGGEFVGDERKCEGSAFHSPRPLVVHEYDLCPWSADPQRHGKVCLCAICGEILIVYQTLLAEGDGRLHYTLTREFGNAIRRLAHRGWDLFQEERKAANPSKLPGLRPR